MTDGPTGLSDDVAALTHMSCKATVSTDQKAAAKVWKDARDADAADGVPTTTAGCAALVEVMPLKKGGADDVSEDAAEQVSTAAAYLPPPTPTKCSTESLSAEEEAWSTAHEALKTAA